MHLMICMRGEQEEVSFLPEIARLGAGIELQSYGMIGVQSEQAWERRVALHKAIRTHFSGTIALHGPFVGVEYAHIDHLLRDAVNRRLDMTFDAAVELRASRVILHSGYRAEIELFNLSDDWHRRSLEFWQQEIPRWAEANIAITLENTIERSPGLLVRLVDEVGNPFLGLCMDIGHQHMFSELSAAEWVRMMDKRLFHIHLHDNDRTGDKHWSIGRGTIDFEPFYSAVMQHAPQAAISLELEEKTEVKLANLRELASHLASKQSALG